jgi:hypothetical protein
MGAQRRKRAEEDNEHKSAGAIANDSAATAQQVCCVLASATIEIIKDLVLKPRRIPSGPWRELIKKVCEVDLLLCTQCHHEIRIVL